MNQVFFKGGIKEMGTRQYKIMWHKLIIICVILLSLEGCGEKDYGEKKTMEKTSLSSPNLQMFQEKKYDENMTSKKEGGTKTIKNMKKKVVFALNGLWIMNTDGTEPKRLTDNFLDQHPILSQDGKKIFYISEVMSNNEYVCEGGPMYAIWSMNIDGTEKRRLLMKKAGVFYGITLMPNDKELLFSLAEDVHGGGVIYILDISGRKIRKLTHNGLNHYPSVSPNGKTIVFDSFRNESDHQIYIMTTDGTQRKRLTFTKCPSILPSFSPDGRKIVFLSWVAMGFDIFIMNTDGTNLKRLTHTPEYSEYSPSFSPDGKKILYLLRKSQEFQIWSVDSSGENPKKLINLPEGIQYLNLRKRRFGGYSFSPDGKKIFFLLNEKNKFNLYTIIDWTDKRKVKKGENLSFNLSLRQFQTGWVLVGKSIAEETRKYEEILKK